MHATNQMYASTPPAIDTAYVKQIAHDSCTSIYFYKSEAGTHDFPRLRVIRNWSHHPELWGLQGDTIMVNCSVNLKDQAIQEVLIKPHI